eukprot:6087448-Pyramimonas_sp.AAC.1
MRASVRIVCVPRLRRRCRRRRGRGARCSARGSFLFCNDHPLSVPGIARRLAVRPSVRPSSRLFEPRCWTVVVNGEIKNLIVKQKV